MISLRPYRVLLTGALLVFSPNAFAQNAATPMAVAPAATATVDPAVVKARAALLAGVTDVTAPGLPGVVSVFGPKAFPVLLGSTGSGKAATVAPAVAAAFTGKGGIVALGHDGLLASDAWEHGQTRQFLINSVRWTQMGRVGKVGVWAGDQNNAIVGMLNANGFQAVGIGAGAKLSDYSALVVNGHRLGNADEAPLAQYLKAGGGLVMGTTGWGWNWNNDAETLSKDYFGNRLLAPYGLVWSEGTVNGTKKDGNNVFTVSDIPTLTNSGDALSLLEASLKDPALMTPDDAKLASRSLSDLLTGLPVGDTVMQKRFEALLVNGGDLQIPTDKQPLGPAVPGARLRYLLALRHEQGLPVAMTKPDPAASSFPGAVPADAKTVTKTVSLDVAVPQWHSLGLYAAPGAIVTISVPNDLASKKFSVRIGCHTDSLVNLDSWQRSPEISRSFPITSTVTQAANAFGGLVYIVVPEGLKGTADVTVSGAVEAPLFELGKTNVADWKNTIRNAPGAVGRDRFRSCHRFGAFHQCARYR